MLSWQIILKFGWNICYVKRLALVSFNTKLSTGFSRKNLNVSWCTESERVSSCNEEALAVNTLKPRQNGRHFADYIFKCIFLNENAWISFKISLKFVPKGLINNIPALVQIMAWRRPCRRQAIVWTNAVSIHPLNKQLITGTGKLRRYDAHATVLKFGGIRGQ